MPEQTNDFVLSRELDAPRETLWACLTQPERMRQWWGPKGCKIVAAKMDLRPGDPHGMEMPNGQTMSGNSSTTRSSHRSGCTFINFFSDENGGVTRHPLAPSWPLELLSTFTLEEANGKRVSPSAGHRATRHRKSAKHSTRPRCASRLDRYRGPARPLPEVSLSNPGCRSQSTRSPPFDAQAEDAANFYVSIFTNLKIADVAYYPDVRQDTHGRGPGSVMVVAFEINGQAFTALKAGCSSSSTRRSRLVPCETQEEIDYFWRRLTEGRRPGVPLRLAEGQVRPVLAGFPEARAANADGP